MLSLQGVTAAKRPGHAYQPCCSESAGSAAVALAAAGKTMGALRPAAADGAAAGSDGSVVTAAWPAAVAVAVAGLPEGPSMPDHRDHKRTFCCLFCISMASCFWPELPPDAQQPIFADYTGQSGHIVAG